MYTVYVEKNIIQHQRTQRILAKLNPDIIIECLNYKEIFNPRSQNFRIQKARPAIILAEKTGTKVLPTPASFGLGSRQNYYFSHMLNCIYDCRYCFLQGMYSSAHYVIFINYEDFMDEIITLANNNLAATYFFSGYDCDSLAFEPVTHFLKEFLPFFKLHNKAILELRTKSTNIKELLMHDPLKNCIVAFSFTPKEISNNVEHGVPSVEKRLHALHQVAKHGWPIGLRFDPLIYCADFEKIYQKLISTIFEVIDTNQIHSISLGALRFPEKMFQKIVKLYPHDSLFTEFLEPTQKYVSYPKNLDQYMKETLTTLLKKYVDCSLLFKCEV